MELWEACVFVLTLKLVLGKDIANVTYEIRKIDSCPVEGYFFKRELAPNQLSPGPCWLCFCQENGTATCWQREQKRCDVEKYHHHRVGRHVRNRRSFTDIFFRDGTREFFNKNLPEQCKPNQSFSSGCPPEDWCLGCTVCDCDTNRRWDCHVLSFCDGKEKKRKVKPGGQKPSRLKPDNVPQKKVRPTKKPTRKPHVKSTTKSPAKNVRKVVRAKNSKIFSNPANKKNKVSNKSNQFKTQAKKQNQKTKTSNKIPTKPIQIRRRPHNKSKPQNQKKNKSNVSYVKVIRRAVTTKKPLQLLHNAIKGLKINPNNNDTVKLGQKIVKQVMTVFQKIMQREMDKLEMERKQRIVDGLDCGKVNKRDKRTYNERSKAAGRNKSKYNRPTLIKENYTNARSKRETDDNSKLDIVSVITLPTDTNGVIPLEIVTIKGGLTTNPSNNFTKTTNLTLQENGYYTYKLKNDTVLSHTTEQMEKVVERIENDIYNSSLIPSDFSNNISHIINEILHDSNITVNETLLYSKQNNAYNYTDINPEYNDIKFNKWKVIKLKKDERKIPVTRLVLSKLGTTKSIQEAIKTDYTHYSTEVARKVELKYDVTKRYNLETSHKPYYTSTSKTDVTGLKHVLESLFTDINSTKHEPYKKRRKFKSKVSILKYVRKFFHNLFSKNKSKNHKIYGLGTQEDHTLQILCENVGPCKLKTNNKLLLKYKLSQLNRETKIVLRSIRTVKGLLHLLELPNNGNPKNYSFQTDIQKLSTVLRDFKDDDMNTTLTFTQRTQIDYIKKNTQVFLDSVKKFADTLTDILEIVTPIPHTEYPTDHLKYGQMTPPNKVLKYKSERKLSKIKDILYKYNIMQNTFMKKMYELINGEEKPTTTTVNPKRIASLKADKNGPDNVIEKYSKNIIDSLRRLKSIVQVLTAKRKKRDLTMREDALDYLLMMMEFLIHNNKALDQRSTDHDGIDLLIDAIKNAPDIKPIKKYNYDRIDYHNTTNSSNIESSDSSGSHSDSRRVSNEETRTDLSENSFIQDNELREAPVGKKTFQVETTQNVYYRRYDDNTDINGIETTTNNNSSNEEKVGFDKFESYIGIPKKFDVYQDEDSSAFSTTEETSNILKPIKNNTARPNIFTPVDDKKSTLSYLKEQKKVKIEDSTSSRVTLIAAESLKQSESSSQSREYTYISNNKTKLDWIEETFDREIKEYSKLLNASSHTTRITELPTTKTSTIQTTKKIRRPNSNSKVRGNLEDHNSKRVAKKLDDMDSEDVMSMKQLAFLNSLDYGTEKSVDFEETESKDDVRSDAEDTAYFV